MKYITIAVDEKSYARMVAGLRVEGSVGYDLKKGLGDLNAYNRKEREPGYKRPKSETLYETVTGRLNQSSETYNIYVSAKKSMGRERCASALETQARDMADHLRFIKTIKDLVGEV